MDMAKYVLVSDPTLSRDYHGFLLLDFIPCASVMSVIQGSLMISGHCRLVEFDVNGGFAKRLRVDVMSRCHRLLGEWGFLFERRRLFLL